MPYYLITGIASERSLAYFIASELSKNPANILILSYQSERFRSRLEEYAAHFNNCSIVQCDVSIEENLINLEEFIAQKCPNGLDGLVHAIAFAPQEQLQGQFTDCINKQGFLTAHEVSSYSLAALTQMLRPHLKKAKGAVLTLSYLGATRVVRHYNVMGLAKASLEACVRYLAADLGIDGVRVNAISAAPIRTLASSGIKGIKDMVQYCSDNNFLKRAVSPEEIACVAVFLLSSNASAITGEIIAADGGFSHACPINF
jgi:enoyl-[acyl-carrier protein] reductase I